MIRKLVFIFVLACTSVAGQDLIQKIGGTIKESATGNVLSGVSLDLLADGRSVSVTTTNEKGSFEFSVSPGRYLLKISYVGFQSRSEEVLVISGKETYLRFELDEAVKELDEVSVVAAPSSNPAPGATDISIEKTIRVPANFFDPMRMASSLPGMVAVNDQGNSMAIKGYSPNAMLWKLEGLDIVNPNHLANAGTLSDKPVSFGGGVSILSSQVLDRTGFYSGWMPARYGNALSAVVDMGLRDGNKSKNEFTAQASLIGLDLAAEGPLGKKENNSYLVNYRYSTVGLLSKLGVNFGDEEINFQDLTFHLDFDQASNSNLSVFGFWGASSNHFKRKPADEWEEEKDRYNIDFEGNTFALGFKESWGRKVKWSLGSVLSSQQQDRYSESETVTFAHIQKETYKNANTILSSTLNAKTKLRTALLEVGVLMNYRYNELRVETAGLNNFTAVYPNGGGLVEGALWQPYLSASNRWGVWSVDAGLRYCYFTFNNSGSLDSRLSFQRPVGSGTVSISYSHVSQWQQTQTYLATGNRDLGLSQANQYMAELRQKLGDQSKLSVSLYYHDLYNLPITTSGAFYSAINQWEEFTPGNLTSKGTAQNLGTEVSYEKSFDNRFYVMVNAALYKSTYKGENTPAFNSRFNGGYTTSASVGKEWGTSNRSFGAHIRFLYLGGMRQQAIDQFNSALLGTTVYDGQGYTEQLPAYWRPDLRLSWRKNKPGYTRTLSVDIQNVANHENIAYRYFDTYTQKVEIKYQLGLIPVIIYRVDF